MIAVVSALTTGNRTKTQVLFDQEDTEETELVKPRFSLLPPVQNGLGCGLSPALGHKMINGFPSDKMIRKEIFRLGPELFRRYGREADCTRGQLERTVGDLKIAESTFPYLCAVFLSEEELRCKQHAAIRCEFGGCAGTRPPRLTPVLPRPSPRRRPAPAE